MRAVVTTGHGGLAKLEYRKDYPEPRPSENEVIVRVAATAINYHDVFTRRGMPGIKVPFPLVVGSDIAGEIASVGEQVEDWIVGDRVLVNPMCLEGTHKGLIGEAFDGGRAEFVRVHQSQLILVPDKVDLHSAAALPLAYATAHRMMITRGQIVAGEKVLVLGASGGVGVACVQIAKMLGAEVLACASSEAKLARLSEIGADHQIDYTKKDLPKAVSEIVGKPSLWRDGGVDVAINFTGGETFIDTQKCVKHGGRILVCGATAGYDYRIDARFLWTFEHQIIGSNGWTVDDLKQLLTDVESGDLSPVVDRTLALEEAAEAERLLEEREVLGKVLLVP